MRVVEGNAKRASVAWSSVSTSPSPSSAWLGGSDVSTCEKAKEEDGREARGQISWSPGGGSGAGVVVGGTRLLSVQDQPVENGVCDDGGA